MDFTSAFTAEIVLNLANDYDDNYDYYRYGNQEVVTTPFFVRFIKKLLKTQNVYRVNYTLIASEILAFDPNYGYFESLYNLLSNKESKELLVKILAYRILGCKKVKLPTNTPQFWQGLSQLENLADKNDFIPIKFMDWKLFKYDLKKINTPIELYYISLGINATFIAKQYEYISTDKVIKVDKNDVVIDAGGCFGDTALYFANEAGENGKVYSFEFIPSNLEVMRKNISLNQNIKERIEIVTNPLWEEPGKDVFYLDNGPGSKVSFEKGDNLVNRVKTATIDDFVERNNIRKIDFIKMDIEGAECNALRGARKVISEFKPKLAIALYHSPEDFKKIPTFIDSLNLGYKFFLGHYSIHEEETVLFAIVDPDE